MYDDVVGRHSQVIVSMHVISGHYHMPRSRFKFESRITWDYLPSLQLIQSTLYNAMSRHIVISLLACEIVLQR